MVNRILLTGAGFTHNFGAPLASTVSNLIFNAIPDQSNEKLLELLKSNFDYEDVYQTVIQSTDFDEKTKNTLIKAIETAYQTIDELIQSKSLSSQINQIKFKEFLKPFDKPHGPGLIFTLNQDLFIERNRDLFPEVLWEIPAPGQYISNNDFSLAKKINRLNISYDNFDGYKAEHQRYFEKSDPRIYYIKLHGSQNWFKDETSQVMVIGHGKSEKIAVEPLLAWYFEIFKNELKKENTKLLIIGYSFRDEHINQAIYENRDNLKIYIINPQSFENFSNELSSKPFGNEIKKIINKYYPISLIELMGTNNAEPHLYWNQLQIEYFDNTYYKKMEQNGSF